MKRASVAMAYDSHRGMTVMFGGRSAFNSTSSLADTWEYDGNKWTRVSTVHTPTARYGHNMAYDEQRRVVILFGGQHAGIWFGDTWEYDGADWTRIYPAHSPSARAGFAMTYDACRQKVVLFGGTGDRRELADTWEYNGFDWVQVSVNTAPPARQLTAMIHDSEQCRIVLWGGLPKGSLHGLSDTWEFDGTNWTQRHPGTSPPGRWAHAMAYDAARQRSVLFGGYGPAYSGGTQLGDTWEYDGNNWIRIESLNTPTSREQHGMAYDVRRGRVVLFGGWLSKTGPGSDTWELSVARPPPQG
jgi:hypothetical protein